MYMLSQIHKYNRFYCFTNNYIQYSKKISYTQYSVLSYYAQTQCYIRFKHTGKIDYNKSYSINSQIVCMAIQQWTLYFYVFKSNFCLTIQSFFFFFPVFRLVKIYQHCKVQTVVKTLIKTICYQQGKDRWKVGTKQP